MVALLAVPTNLDEIDRAILRELQNDGRLTIADLALRVGLSAPPCAYRVRILEERGIIRGYAALLDEPALGFGFSVFVSMKLDRQVDDALCHIAEKVKSFPEVVDCWLMTGNRDYLIRIAVTGLAEHEAFLTTGLNRIKGIASIESSIPLRRVKARAARRA